MKVLFITNELLNSCGVSNHLYYLLPELIKLPDMEILLLCGGGDAVDKFKELRIPIIVDAKFNHKYRSIKRYLFALLSLYRLIKNNKIEIIHSHNHYAASIAFYASKITGTKTILTNHGLFPEVGILNHYLADYIVAVNNHIYDYIISNKSADNLKVRLIRNGVPLSGFKKSRNKKIKFLAASRLVKGKGIDVFIKAVSLLPPNYKERAEFCFAGKGELEDVLLEVNKNLKEPVVFLGEIKNLKKELLKYDVFVFSSTSEEGFPIAMTEAAFAKNLIITSTFRGLEPIFDKNEDGLTFRINDAVDLAEKIKYAIDKFPQLTRLVEVFYIKVIELFDLKRMVTEIVKLYTEIL